MPKTYNVVAYSDQIDLYLTVYAPEFENCQWSANLEIALKYETLEAAQQMALMIGGGTVGTTRP